MLRRLGMFALCLTVGVLTGCSKGPLAIFTFPFRPGSTAAASDSVGARMASVHDQPRHASVKDENMD
jgi:hypothetical protein